MNLSWRYALCFQYKNTLRVHFNRFWTNRQEIYYISSICFFLPFSIRFRNCSCSVVCFRTIPAVWYVLELFRQCGMFWNYSCSVVCFGTIPAVWYVLELFRQCGMFYCSFYYMYIMLCRSYFEPIAWRTSQAYFDWNLKLAMTLWITLLQD